ncbi:immunoglobulin-like and fibronectin type III domain-containing protein 1 [Synchiropus splendidus]|uniref:immunoglobulin-like and fibronectin type III domain-containing protein 1 n=1 Tax=Synchiropus splendidus TaxID=270530 RepID=UPI00237D9A82|nr:immunoglobulin-like and fibronectin type III domain-containing protein 1 [Synchiropus splendidus]
MWKKTNGTGRNTARQSYSLVHQYIQHFNEVSGNKSAAIRRRSKIPGVLITQYLVNIPEGKSTPDFQSAPEPMTVQEGKTVIFKAVVTGNPEPEVSWKRVKGNISDKTKFQTKFDKSTGEYILKINSVSAGETDTYKCFAANEFGKAVCNAALHVTHELAVESDFRKVLRKTKVDKTEDNQATTDSAESNEKFWDAMLNADKADYERICQEFGVKDVNTVLKNLEEKRTNKRAQNQRKNTKMNLQNIEDVNLIDVLSQMDTEELNFLHAQNNFPNVDFVIKILEITAEEGDDALFECVLTRPLSRISWSSKGIDLEDGEKYSITVSDHKLIHRLLIKDCTLQDKGIYSAVAGSTSCSAWLIVEAASGDPSARKKTCRSAMGAGGIDLEEVAKQQLLKNREEMETMIEGLKAKFDPAMGPDGDKSKLDLMMALLLSETGAIEGGNIKILIDGTVQTIDVSELVSSGEEKRQKRVTFGQDTSDEVTEQGDILEDEDLNHSQLFKTNQSTDPGGQQLPPGSPSNSSLTGATECGDRVADETGAVTQTRRKRQTPLTEDLVIDPGVQFVCGLSDVSAIIDHSAELTCKLSNEDCVGAWFRDGRKIQPDDNFTITQEGAIHKLVINKCQDEHSGKYRFEADGRKTEAMVNVKDPPRINPEELSAFTEPLAVKVGHNAIFKVHFVGHEPIKIQWYREGEELLDDSNTKIERYSSHSRLLLSRCHRKDKGEIKIKLKNDDGFVEALSRLVVLDKPTAPMGPVEVIESLPYCIEFKWRPPKDDGGSPVTNYIIERQQVGRNTWRKLGEIPGLPVYSDSDVDHGRKYCYRIRAVTSEGVSDVMETDEIQAGKLAFPGPPAPPKVVSAFDDCINLSWSAPSNRGGSQILGYILEKRKKGSNLWTVVNTADQLIKEKKCAVKDVVAGLEYEFRVTAVNHSGAGEFSNPCEFVFARDPKQPPGKVIGLKVAETSYSHINLTWTKPEDKPEIQDEAKGYFVEIRPADCLDWSRCNTTPMIITSYSVKGLKAMEMYWVRVIATNDGGDGEPAELPNYVLAMPSLVRPKFTNRKMNSFTVVRAGNSVRLTINFEASPLPEIRWLKDNVPVTRRVTVSNSDGSSQLLIPSSERSDSGIYTILLKNLAGQETFSTEIRVTDDPKPPGLVQLEENVPGTVTVTWEPSPDEKRDDRLHYTISALDSTKRTWSTVADRLFNNKFTVCNIMPGREYNFRVYAKNDMGVSAPSESPTWETEKKKEKLLVTLPAIKDCDLKCPPTFVVPLKLHAAPKGYECYMSCAVRGNPKPRITWYRNHISLNTNANYYISETCGVCSMLILRVGPKDTGEYIITAENALGRAECSTTLSVRE